MNTTTLDYQAFYELLNQQNAWFSPSYAHGVLSALVAIDKVERYPQFLFFQESPNDLMQKAFAMLAQHIENSLKLETLSYQLMLPTETSLSWRAEALTDWALAVTRVWSELSPEVAGEAEEFVQDVASIADLDTQLVDHDHNQRQLMEVEEYCRVGIVLVYEEVRVE
ncbi:MAG: UPF0149 family protein [Cardiobacteriaceae bacterium]|nr:UPF0149 family protein [Cardiobacteriaceae bacterium]